MYLLFLHELDSSILQAHILVYSSPSLSWAEESIRHPHEEFHVGSYHPDSTGDSKAHLLDCHVAWVNMMWGLLEKNRCQQRSHWLQTVVSNLTWIQRLLMAAGLLPSIVHHLLMRGAPDSILLTLLPTQPQEGLPTWHDDIRKSQFSCNCQSPIKYHGVFSPNLFHVSAKKLQRNDKTCKNKSIFLLRTTYPLCTIVLEKT